MKLFFKHLLKSIKNRPLQPFILIFTIILSVLVCAVSLSVGSFINKENDVQQSLYYGKADFTVSLSSTSSSRFAFAKDAQKILRDKAKVTGVYEFPLFLTDANTNAFCAATDFFSVNNVFSLEFSEYLPVTENDIYDCAFISREFSKKFDVKIGQTFNANAFGYDKTYVVHGISETPFLSGCDALVDITGVMRLLATDSLFVGALGDDFKPCTTIFVAVKDGISITDCIELLKSNENFADKSFAIVKDSVKNLSSLDSLNVTVGVIIGLSLALCVAVTFCCFYILSRERAEENALFNTVGAKPFYLNVLQFAEIFVYWLIGAPLGILLSLPLAKFIDSAVGFRYVEFVFGAKEFLLSAALVLIITLFTALVFILSSRRKKRVKKPSEWFVLILAVAFIVSFVLTFLIDVSLKFICTCACILFLFFLFFCAIPFLLRLFTSRVNKLLTHRLKKGKNTKATLIYAFKNVTKVDMLQNSSRLLTIIISIVLTVSVCIAGGAMTVENYRRQLTGDFVVFNATEQCESKLKNADGVKDVYSVFYDVTERNGVTIPLVSASSINALSKNTNLAVLPKDNDAYISFGLSESLRLALGDTLSFSVGDKEVSVKIAGVLRTNINCLIFNNEYFDLPFTILTVQGNSDIDKETLRSSISGALALEMATVTSISEFTGKKIQASELYINAGYLLAPLMVLFALIGFFDNLLESYRARKEEFALYKTAGMTNKDITVMKINELCLTFAFAILAGIIAAVISTLAFNEGFLSFSYSLLLNFFG